MGALYDRFLSLIIGLDTHVMESVIWALIAGVVFMSVIMTVVLWKQAEYDKTYDKDISEPRYPETSNRPKGRPFPNSRTYLCRKFCRTRLVSRAPPS